MAAIQKQHYTVEEYLTLDGQDGMKYEYLSGEVHLMAGATEPHIIVAGDIHASFHSQLRKKPCRAYNSGMRVKTPTNHCSYPDVTAVRGERQFTQDKIATLLNPTLIVELLSDTTRDFDRGEKFRHYRTLTSLQEYVLVAPDMLRVAHHVRQPDNRWLFSETTDSGATITLESIGCTLALADVYENVSFGEAE
jgi:Uma2 family endonuclease